MTTCSGTEKFSEVLLGEVLAFKLADFFFQSIMFLLKLVDLFTSHALSLLSQFNSKLQVVRYSLLCLNLGLNLLKFFGILGLFYDDVIPTLGGETHLGELEEEFELCVEVFGNVEIVLIQDEELDSSSYFAVLVNLTSNFFRDIFVKLFWLASSHSGTKCCCIDENLI